LIPLWKHVFELTAVYRVGLCVKPLTICCGSLDEKRLFAVKFKITYL
jgi:hypothetical protein